MKNSVVLRTVHTIALTVMALTVMYANGAEGQGPSSLPKIPFDSQWSYLDTDAAPPLDWASKGAKLSNWKTGRAILGYGNQDVKTVVEFGPDPENKYLVTYFRREFSLSQPELKEKYEVGLYVDDGAVVYINGREVGRINVGAGEVNHRTPAIDVGTRREEKKLNIPAEYLELGMNVIGVSVHQAYGGSSDISFKLELRPISEPIAGRGAQHPQPKHRGYLSH